MSKCVSRMPGTMIPDELYFCSANDTPTPSRVQVTTDRGVKVNVTPASPEHLPNEETCGASYAKAIELAQKGNTVRHIVHHDHHPDTLITASPVRMRKQQIGVLVGVSAAPSQRDLITQMIV